jgi:transcriptional repressor NrdR
VIKKDGTKQYYDRSKILRGIIRACEKTGIAYERLEAIVDQIEAQLEQRNKKEVSSQEIGDLVLHHLRSLSEVAYIRFASVYGQFTGIEDFVATLNDLRKQEKTEENGQYTALCLYKN